MHSTLVVYEDTNKDDALRLAAIIGNAKALDIRFLDTADVGKYTHVVAFGTTAKPVAAEVLLSKDCSVANEGKELRRRFDQADGNVMEPALLRVRIEEFLKAHNSCALATASDGLVRSTPIEYGYRDGCLFFLTEGGLKFIGLSRCAVSIADPYVRFGKLAGFEAQGSLTEIPADSPLYGEILKEKQVDPSVLARSPITMHMLRFAIKEGEMLCSTFHLDGYGVRQYFTW